MLLLLYLKLLLTMCERVLVIALVTLKLTPMLTAVDEGRGGRTTTDNVYIDPGVVSWAIQCAGSEGIVVTGTMIIEVETRYHIGTRSISKGMMKIGFILKTVILHCHVKLILAKETRAVDICRDKLQS